MEFAVKQEAFAGPLGLLLDLLQKKELEITDVALAGIADDYLHYIENADVAHEELADFLLIASRLIYLKSKELMPYLQIDEEDEGPSLEEQLRAYRLFVEAAQRLEERYTSRAHVFRQPVMRLKKEAKEPQFISPKAVVPGTLRDAFDSVLKRLEPFFALQETSIQRVKSVEERMEELTGAIRTRQNVSFKDVVKSAKSKADVVVSFLALLELIRRQVVRAKQGSGHDIMIEKVT